MNALKRMVSMAAHEKQPWWIKIQTQIPECTYYFGPFERKKEAVLSQAGYAEDLAQEGAQDMTLTVEKARPNRLTHCALDSTPFPHGANVC